MMVKNEYRLNRCYGACTSSQITMLYMYVWRLDEAKYSIFVLLYVRCFQRQPFRYSVVCHSLFLMSSTFGASGRLCFVTVVFSGFRHLFFLAVRTF